jgi:hypothetical protein
VCRSSRPAIFVLGAAAGTGASSAKNPICAWSKAGLRSRAASSLSDTEPAA